jgi:hypothetical protein
MCLISCPELQITDLFSIEMKENEIDCNKQKTLLLCIAEGDQKLWLCKITEN